MILATYPCSRCPAMIEWEFPDGTTKVAQELYARHQLCDACLKEKLADPVAFRLKNRDVKQEYANLRQKLDKAVTQAEAANIEARMSALETTLARQGVDVGEL